MSMAALLNQNSAMVLPATSSDLNALTIEACKETHKLEVLAFLARRPIHTVIMAGFIHDNGLISPLNRGSFYTCRDLYGRLQGVALIGHATLVEAHSQAVVQAFAKFAQDFSFAHVIMGEQEKIELFWRHYCRGGQAPRLICRELLFEQRFPPVVRHQVPELRLAELGDLENVMKAQAEMAYQESGINPLEADAAGFHQRCARRIEKNRVWVLMKDDRLIFKTDVISETAEVIYLEGVYVGAEERREGYGLACLSQLVCVLLARTPSICLLVNEQNLSAQALYKRAGFSQRSCYDSIFLHQQTAKLETHSLC